MDFKYRFSVIIPVYNVEPYLEDAIESVLCQDIGFEAHIQLILVNDGSTDNSEFICLGYQSRYPDNIIYLKQENTGVSAARNAGIPYIEGKYVNFLDGDDRWASDAFSKVFDFFEANSQTIDVVACRVEFFEGRTGFYPLDEKFRAQDPARIINILKEYNALHIHTSSSFLKTEALGALRFDPELKFGEDTLFLTHLILKKRKYGALYHARSYYRRRKDSSAVLQRQPWPRDWYFVSPKHFLHALAKGCITQYGAVFPYVQAILFYDIGFRLKTPLDTRFTKVEIQAYLTMLRTLLRTYVSDLVILNQSQYPREIQLLALRLKYGSELEDHLTFVETAVYFDNYELISFSSSQELLQITALDIRKDQLFLEGTLCKWLVDLLGDNYTLAFHSQDGGIRQSATFSDLPVETYPTLLGPQPKFIAFHFEFPLLPTQVYHLKPVLQFHDCYFCRLRFTFSQFSPLTHELPEVTYCFFGRYLAELEPPYLKLSAPAHPTRILWKHERTFRKHLKALGVGYLNRYRRKALRLRRFHKKKIWLISDQAGAAGDNGEAFFRYLTHHHSKDVIPYFVIRRNCLDFKRLRRYGKVIPLYSKKNKIYALAADCFITSSGADFSFDPFQKDRQYIKDLMQGNIVFLQHDVLKEYLPASLHKNRKNFRLFLTSAPAEYHGILTGGYGYTKRELALTGLARFDTLLERAAILPVKKQLLVFPTWRKWMLRLPFDDSVPYPETSDLGTYRLGFQETEFYQFYQDLLQHPRLQKAMQEMGYTGLFALPPMIAAQSVDFQGNESFTIQAGRLDYAAAFAESQILLTDYSGVAFDFAYLKKPVVYAQFDQASFFSGKETHPSYFDYSRDGFGPICMDLESTVDELIALMEREGVPNDIELERIEQFFAYNDGHNCRRIRETIENLD